MTVSVAHRPASGRHVEYPVRARRMEGDSIGRKVRARSARHGDRVLEQWNDPNLVAAVAAGDAEAFGVLVDRHAGALYRVAARMLGDGAEAEDVVQDCFVRLWQNAPRWRPSGAGLVGWLHRVTINLCFDRRRRTRATTTPDLPDRADPAPLADT